MANQEELKQSFVEVRKAYRLLYEYQKKVLDLMSYINAYFGFNNFGWWQHFSNKLQSETKINLNNWAWDWLPMYFSDFHFTKGDLKLSVLLVSDSGYFDNNDDISFENYAMKLNLNKFESPEKSETRIIFVLDKDKRDILNKGSRWHSNHLFKDYKKQDIVGDTIYKIHNLEEFHSQESTDTILEQLSKFAIENNFELKKVDL